VNPAANRAAQAMPTASAWSVPPPPVVAANTPVVDPAANAMPAGAAVTPAAPALAAVKPQPPPTPAAIAHQEQEARMLVSDLLEIGMAQRKAYEEAQKKAAAEKAQGR
jgi:hypothetical protein